MLKYIIIIWFSYFGICVASSLMPDSYGCALPNDACYDSLYPDIKIWANAGVSGGIPTVTKIKKIVFPGENIQDAINEGGTGVVLLRKGVYTVTSTIVLRDSVVLRGVSKDDVKLSIKIKSGQALHIPDSVTYSAIENMKIVYEMLDNEPIAYRNYEDGYSDGGYCSECFQNDKPEYDNILLKIEGNNNWVDNVELHNSGSNPVFINGNNNTFRNSLVDNCYNKGGGGEGYFDLRGYNNLIIGSTIRLIRHFAIQQKAKYNVVYKNRIEVDVNFHNKDLGHNLIEQNTLIRPSWHTWGVFATGGAQYGHSPPGPDNIIVNNNCYDYRENHVEFSKKDMIYTFTGYGNPIETNWKMPKCGTFYAVKDPDSINIIKQEPFLGSPHLLPGKIEAEDYDKGGEGISYHDIDSDNKGGIYRTEGVDIEVTTDSIGKYNVGYITAGEWLEYMVFVEKAGMYDFTFRTSSKTEGGTVSLLSEDDTLITNLKFPVTGAWQMYTNTIVKKVLLRAGKQIFRFYVVNGGFNINYMSVKVADEETFVIPHMGIHNERITLYPNPATTNLNIIAQEPDMLFIIDRLGRKVMKIKCGDNDISCLQPGVYFVVMQSGIKVKSLKRFYKTKYDVIK